MSQAIRNVGELASPYWLLEVWARRGEIDIDPETYATLKQKARRLVQQARGFETRGEEPGEDWRTLRRDLLGFNGSLQPRAVPVDGGEPFPLSVWTSPGGTEDVIVGDLPGLTDPDLRPPEASDPPATRFELALDACPTETDWGLLLAGLQLRVYRRSSGISQQYLGLDFGDLVELDDEPQWKAFAAVFRAPAFDRTGKPMPLIQHVVDQSRRHAAELADDMRRDVVEAAEALLQGALRRPENREVLGEPGRTELQDLFEETLYLLYRLLFVLYAESREVLPLSAGSAYATSYSVDHLVERARLEPPDVDGTYYHRALETLFALLWDGPEQITRRLGFAPVGGELFDPARTPRLGRAVIGDPEWRRALLAISIGAEGSPRRRLGKRSSFAELGVDQLGSIYEGLLVMEPHLAPGAEKLVLLDGERRVVPADFAGRAMVLRDLQQGDFVLESASKRRKGSGSFYTPHEITEYLTHAALDPLLAPLVARAKAKPSEAVAEILALRVCDPAMGSGAFLVQAARVLGLALARARAGKSNGCVTPDLVHKAKREVVRRCLYGLDLNPLAVALAKVSLWLETLEPGRPLTFLDTRLRQGDSLVGLLFEGAAAGATRGLAIWPEDATQGLVTYLKNEAGERGRPVQERLKRRRGRADREQLSLPGFGPAAVEEALQELAAQRSSLIEGEQGETRQLELEVARRFHQLDEAEESLRNRLRLAADFQCAQWFAEGEDAPCDVEGPVVPGGKADYEEVVRCLLAGQPLAERLRPQLDAARQVAKRRRFFHWGLEFPEVFARGGFDAVLGNPPWNTLSPDRNEFFSTYDPSAFGKGTPKPQKDQRIAELRSNPEVDAAWRKESRYLHELSRYAKPESGKFLWYAEDGQLRKGDANIFRLFVERAHMLLREGGRLAQVLPDSLYVSAPATGVRQHLLGESVLERCWVFENRKALFPIHRSVKVVLLVAQRGGGPTERFKAAFFTGKKPDGTERAVGLDELPRVLADLDREAPELTVDQVKALAAETWSFPELQTALDAQIVAQVAACHPALNLDERGWGLTFCRGMHSSEDAHRFRNRDQLEGTGAHQVGVRWCDEAGDEWWPVAEGALFYHLELPAEGAEPRYWVKGCDICSIPKYENADGSRVFDHYRVGWRDIASATNERSAISCILPPRTAEKDTTLTVWGGLLDARHSLSLAAMMSSFAFDYLVRFSGKTHLKYSAVNPMPAPTFGALSSPIIPTAEVVCRSPEFDALWTAICPDRPRPNLDTWQVAERRARIDALVARAYGLSLVQFAAVLSTFPNVDRSQPMLPGEPKSFVTRDLALLAYCQEAGQPPADVHELLVAAGVDLPRPKAELRLLDARVAAARALGAVPYRPTPQGARTPTDPAFIEEVCSVLTVDAQTAEEVAEAIGAEAADVAKILKTLADDEQIFAEGRGKNRRYYVIGEP